MKVKYILVNLLYLDEQYNSSSTQGEAPDHSLYSLIVLAKQDLRTEINPEPSMPVVLLQFVMSIKKHSLTPQFFGDSMKPGVEYSCFNKILEFLEGTNLCQRGRIYVRGDVFMSEGKYLCQRGRIYVRGDVFMSENLPDFSCRYLQTLLSLRIRNHIL